MDHVIKSIYGQTQCSLDRADAVQEYEPSGGRSYALQKRTFFVCSGLLFHFLADAIFDNTV